MGDLLMGAEIAKEATDGKSRGKNRSIYRPAL